MKRPPIDLAIKAAGSLTDLAKLLGVDIQVVHNWRKRGIPVDRVPAVEQVTSVPRHKLRPDRPDLFPVPTDERAAA